MTKNEFKQLLNRVIRTFNENHNVDISIVVVDNETSDATVIGQTCNYHGIVAMKALLQSVATRIAHEHPDLLNKLEDDVMTSILEQTKPKPGERGN